jgi:hypothetical protein
MLHRQLIVSSSLVSKEYANKNMEILHIPEDSTLFGELISEECCHPEALSISSDIWEQQ